MLGPDQVQHHPVDGAGVDAQHQQGRAERPGERPPPALVEDMLRGATASPCATSDRQPTVRVHPRAAAGKGSGGRGRGDSAVRNASRTAYDVRSGADDGVVTVHAPTRRIRSTARVCGRPRVSGSSPPGSGAVLLPLVTCAVLATVRDSITAATAVLVLVLWVVAAASTGDRAAGLLAAVSARRLVRLLPDRALPAVRDQGVRRRRGDRPARGDRPRGHRDRALGPPAAGPCAGRSGYLEGVLGAARLVSEGDTPAAALVDVVARQITDVLGADECRFVEGPGHRRADRRPRPRR